MYLQFKEDPSFKPQGGQLGENDMDYDTDEKSMATLRRHLRAAREEYYRCKRYLYLCRMLCKLVWQVLQCAVHFNLFQLIFNWLTITHFHIKEFVLVVIVCLKSEHHPLQDCSYDRICWLSYKSMCLENRCSNTWRYKWKFVYPIFSLLA